MTGFFQHSNMGSNKGDSKLRLNVGCGNFPIEGYVNLDSHSPKADVLMDFFDFIKEDHLNEFDEVLASHMLEHVSRPNSMKFLGGVFNILKPGGLISLVVPDFDYIAECWFKSKEYWKWLDLHDRVYGLQNHEGEFHRSAWNRDHVSLSLSTVGFTEVWTSYGWDHDQRTIMAGGTKPKED